MRSLKKLLALLIAVVMMASVFAVPVFAEAEDTAETTDEEVVLSSGEKLELLGLLIGDGEGVTDTYLAKSSTRMQLAILDARWGGFEEEANAYAWTDEEENFVDYDDGTSDAEMNMLAFYYADPDLGFVGIGGDIFDPQAPITNKELAKILLVSMGYPYGDEYDWEDILDFADITGLALGSSEVEITNAELADGLVAALESVSAYGTEEEPMTFAQYLLDAGIVTEEDLIAAGINYLGVEESDPDVELSTLEVVSAEANNFSEIELTFNQKVDPESVDKVIVKVDNNSVSADSKTYVVDEYGEGTVVRVYEPEGFVGAQNEYRTVNMTGLSTVGGIVMTAFSQQITFRDSAAPSIEKIVAKGNTRLDVYFSEPLQARENTTERSSVLTLSNYQVGGRALSASSPTINTDGDTDTARIVTVKDVRTSLAAGTYVMGILGTNFKDFAGNSLGYQTAEFEIIADSTGPIAQRVLDPVYQYKVQIEFDEEITEDAYIRWVDGSRNNNSDKTTVDGNVATFEFTSDSRVIPIAGTTVTLVNAKDYSNNAAQAPLSFDVVPVADTLRPAVVSYGSDSDGKIWFKFNKDIDSAIDLGRWTMKNPNDDSLYADVDFSVEFDNTKNARKLVLNPLSANAKENGTYKFTIKGIKDTVYPVSARNQILDVTIEVSVSDADSVSILKATWGKDTNIATDDRRIINIYFDEDIDYGSAVTRANYRTRVIRAADGATVSGQSYKSLPNSAQIKLLSGNRTVSITFNDSFNTTDIINKTNAVEISVTDIQDLFGNRTSAAARVVDATPTMMYNNIKSAKVTDLRKIEVEFTSEISAYDATNFTLVTGTEANKSNTAMQRIAINSASLSNDSKKVTLLLNNDVKPNGTFGSPAQRLTLRLSGLVDFADTQWKGVTDGIKPKLIDSFYRYSDDSLYSGFDKVGSIFLIFDESLALHTSTTDWGAAFSSIRIGSDTFVNGAGQTKDDSTVVGWTVIAPRPVGNSEGYYYIEIDFNDYNATSNPTGMKLKDGTISFTYFAQPGYQIVDGGENLLPSDAFSGVTVAGVRFGY